jgi:hypothetical protein
MTILFISTAQYIYNISLKEKCITGLNEKRWPVFSINKMKQNTMQYLMRFHVFFFADEKLPFGGCQALFTSLKDPLLHCYINKKRES